MRKPGAVYAKGCAGTNLSAARPANLHGLFTPLRGEAGRLPRTPLPPLRDARRSPPWTRLAARLRRVSQGVPWLPRRLGNNANGPP